jgi:hypothetical protein
MTWSQRHSEGALRSLSYASIAPDMGTIAVALSAVVLAVREDEPVVAILPAPGANAPTRAALPGGPFGASEHDSLDAGLRACVERQTGLSLRQTRQISTASGRGAGADGMVSLVLSISYLALIGPEQLKDRGGVAWHSWYHYFPWEDWRHGRPACLKQDLEPPLRAWAAQEPACASERLGRSQRVRLCFGCDGAAWDEEKVLERYELLCEAGLIAHGNLTGGDSRNVGAGLWQLRHAELGEHGRVLASAIAELRRLIKYRPVVFELMPEVFTLFELQKTVEAILGPHLHKQNFRRLVEGGGLVEPTEHYRFRTGGRPARLYRFRPDVLLERLAPGVRIKHGRL